MTWHREPPVGLAPETAGTDPLPARIVTAAVGTDDVPRTSRPVAGCRAAARAGAGAAG